MDIRTRSYDDVTIISVVGRLDTGTASVLEKVFHEQLAAGNVKLVADLKKLSFTSSSGIRVLIGALQESRQRGGDLRLAAPQPNVSKVLKLVGVTGISKTYPNVVAATASYFG